MSSDAIKTSERFSHTKPLKFYNDVRAEIETERNGHTGQVFIYNGWLTVTQARELRDWLNKVIP